MKLSCYIYATLVLSGCATGIPGDNQVGVEVPAKPVEDGNDPPVLAGPCADKAGTVLVTGEFTGGYEESGALITARVQEVGAEATGRQDTFRVRTRYTADQSFSFFDIAATGNGNADTCRFCAFIILEDGTFLIGAEGAARDIDSDFQERLAGTLEGVVFREVASVGPGTSEVVEGGCELTMEQVLFDEETLP